MFDLKMMSNMNRAFLDTAQPSLPYPTYIHSLISQEYGFYKKPFMLIFETHYHIR